MIIQQLAQSNPGIAQQLAANPEILMKMLADPAGYAVHALN